MLGYEYGANVKGSRVLGNWDLELSGSVNSAYCTLKAGEDLRLSRVPFRLMFNTAFLVDGEYKEREVGSSRMVII